MSSLMRTPMRTESAGGDGGGPCSAWAFPVMPIGAQPPMSTRRATAMITKKPNFLTFSPVLLERSGATIVYIGIFGREVQEGSCAQSKNLSSSGKSAQNPGTAAGDISEIAGIKRQREMPQHFLSSSPVTAFCQALKNRLLDRTSGFGRRYLRLLVDEIRVMGKEVRIRGSYSALAQAVSQKSLGTPVGVPRFGYAWLPGQDSNLQPSG